MPLTEQLKNLLHLKKSKAYYAKKLNITEEEVDELLKELRGSSTNFVHTVGTPIIPCTITYTNSQKVDNDKGTLASEVELDFEPKNNEELAELHKIDLTKYKISSYWSKLKSNGKFTSSVFATLIKPEDYSIKDFEKFLESYTPTQTAIIKKEVDWRKNTIDLELSISDFHLAKKTLEGETLANKKEQYINTVIDLVSKVDSIYTINKLVFPISNDFFHTDNYQNQTTAGTPQDVLTSYDHEYEVGFDLLVNTIYYLYGMSTNLEIVLVQGNHDRTKSFYLAHALEVYFKQNKAISFKREHSVTKSTVLGNTFIGYHHGNCKIDDLPLLFATGKDSQAFGNAKYREVHTGDKHHYMAKEIKGVRIQQMPSLSGTDRWHQDNNFVNSIRAGIATVYDPIKGRIAEFESRI